MKRFALIGCLMGSLSLPLHSQEVRDTLSPSQITVDQTFRIPESQTGLQRLNKKDFSRVSVFGAPDIMRTLQAMPGVSMGSELSSGLYVRGGDGSDNLLFLDGVPIYNMSHLFGLFSVVDPGIIDRLDFFRSGFPARRGGAASSIIDAYARDGNPDSLRVELSLGIVDSRFLVEGPIGRQSARFIVSGRISPISLFINPALKYLSSDGADFSYFTDARMGYFEVDARLLLPISPSTDLYLNTLFNRDYRQTGINRRSDENSNNTLWGNLLASAGMRHKGSRGEKTDASIYFTGTYSSLYSLRERSEEKAYREGVKKYYIFRQEGNASPLGELGIRSDSWLQQPSGTVLRYGGRFSFLQNSPMRIYHFLEKEDSQIINKEDIVSPMLYRLGTFSVYTETEWHPLSSVTLQGGFRYSLYLSDGKGWHCPEPHLSVGYTIFPGLSFKASYDRMNQPLHQISSTFESFPTSCLLPSTRKIRPVVSDQVSFGSEFKKGNTFLLSGELYYKRMAHLYEYGGVIMMFPPLDAWESYYLEGLGRSYGLETQMSYKRGTFRLDAAYTLSWSERKFEDFYSSWYPDRYDNRHKIHLNLSRERKGYDWHIAWTFHSGNRTTLNSYYSIGSFRDNITYNVVNFASAPNSFVFPSYHRLDAGISFRYKTARGLKRIASFDIYNIYSRKNPVSVHIRDAGTNKHRLEYHSLFPIIPSFRAGFEF